MSDSKVREAAQAVVELMEPNGRWSGRATLYDMQLRVEALRAALEEPDDSYTHGHFADEWHRMAMKMGPIVREAVAYCEFREGDGQFVSPLTLKESMFVDALCAAVRAYKEVSDEG